MIFLLRKSQKLLHYVFLRLTLKMQKLTAADPLEGEKLAGKAQHINNQLRKVISKEKREYKEFLICKESCRMKHADKMRTKDKVPAGKFS